MIPALPSASPRGTAQALVFSDLASGARLSLQVDPAARDHGFFSFQIPDRGVYYGTADSGLQASPSDVTLDYQGSVTLSPLVSFDGATLPGIVKAPTKVSVRLQARLDPRSRTGTATLVHDGAVIRMTASMPSVADLDPVLRTFEEATVAEDALALYSVMNTDITEAYTSADFARQWAAEIARVGRVSALRRISVGPPQANEVGFWLVVVEYESERISTAGVRTTARYDAHFVRQRVGWKLLFTAER